MQEIDWRCVAFDELSIFELYAILQLRAEVFVVEQQCVYQDLDNCDQAGLHVLGSIGDELACYTRLLPPGLKYPDASIGRVVTRQTARGGGFGQRLMEKSLAHCHDAWPDTPISISAQQYLERFYQQLGFKTRSEPYLEDGIPHIEMRLFRN